MELDKEIALQIKRVETLQKEVFGRKPSGDDVRRPEDMRAERVETLRRAISDLRKRREQVNARFDAEIEGYEAELKSVESRKEVDLGGARFGKGRSKDPTRTSTLTDKGSKTKKGGAKKSD